MQLLTLALIALLPPSLAAPSEDKDSLPPAYTRERSDEVCHVDIYRLEKLIDYGTPNPFYLSAEVYDNGDNKVAEMKLQRCAPMNDHGGQRCKFWDGIADDMYLSPIFKAGAHQSPERDYVQVELVSIDLSDKQLLIEQGVHTRFTTDNGADDKGLRHYCHQKRYFRDKFRTMIWWTCNFQCCESNSTQVKEIVTPGGVQSWADLHKVPYETEVIAADRG
ncbi:hypothetical protein AMS68_002003 [Peltaster fructicola]|uniref:Uncharacterized protein n=1 Tax=Peltaster fructicola TaxID=286661 RepID=A0A6H0XP77_9PEZI|nr:hypothetical protein AMS68_002003 [Peltaster fructicola]